LISFNVYDVVATKYILQHESNNGVWIEVNPIANFILEKGGYNALSFFKLFFVFLLGTMLLLYEKKQRVIPLLTIITIPYGLLATWQTYVIFFLL
jgi:hypothetical protein